MVNNEANTLRESNILSRIEQHILLFYWDLYSYTTQYCIATFDPNTLLLFFYLHLYEIVVLLQ